MLSMYACHFASHTSLDTTLHSRDFIQGRDPFATPAAFIVPLILLRTNRLWDFTDTESYYLAFVQ